MLHPTLPNRTRHYKIYFFYFTYLSLCRGTLGPKIFFPSGHLNRKEISCGGFGIVLLWRGPKSDQSGNFGHVFFFLIALSEIFLCSYRLVEVFKQVKSSFSVLWQYSTWLVFFAVVSFFFLLFLCFENLHVVDCCTRIVWLYVEEYQWSPSLPEHIKVSCCCSAFCFFFFYSRI